MSVEVRLTVRAAGETHRTEWVPASGEPDDAPDADVVERAREQLVDVLDSETLLPVQFTGDGGRRLLAARYVEWVDVEVRRVDDLITTREAGELLGVSRQRVLQLRDTHEDFPRPVGEEGAALRWSRTALTEWDTARRAGGAG